MSQSNKSISPLRQRMVEDMTLRKLEPETQKGYIRSVKKLAQFQRHRNPTTTVLGASIPIDTARR